MDYTIVNGELYHYGVKGMKWGQRKAVKLEKRATRKFTRVGKKLGQADYYRQQGAEAAKKHEANAKVFDKAAKAAESQGKYFKAEAARKAAAAIRQRGANIQASNDEMAAAFIKRATKLQEKASSYATKKRVDLGKKKIDSILKAGQTKGYNREKAVNEYNRENKARAALGDDGYAAYNYIRGK